MRARPINPHRAPDTGHHPAHWSKQALCRTVDPEAFFPTGRGTPGQQDIDDAKAVCRSCPVRMPCALAALRNGWEHGVWGDLDEAQRRHLTRRKPANLEQAIRSEWAAAEYSPLFNAYARRSEQEDDGHVRWLVQNKAITAGRRVFTPAQLAFEIGHGRRPVGTVRPTCGRSGCVAAEHLADDVIRGQCPLDAAA